MTTICIILAVLLTIVSAWLALTIVFLRRMHKAEDAYGDGFYSDDVWRVNYAATRSMAFLLPHGWGE